MTGLARIHHYIPQCYLRGFATGAGKHCRLFVADMLKQHFFATHPKKVCAERDFNTISIKGYTPDALEKSLSGFESQVANAIRDVTKRLSFEGENKLIILNLVALLAVRSPQMRDMRRRYTEDLVKMVARATVGNPKLLDHVLRRMRDDGVSTGNVSVDKLREFVSSDRYSVEIPRERQIATEFALHDDVLHQLAARSWRVFVSQETSACFVTSDRPVSLIWVGSDPVPALRGENIGFAMESTRVQFPLTRSILLVGEFDGPDAVVSASKPFVGIANHVTARNASARVFAPQRDFPYADERGVMQDGRVLFDRVSRTNQ